MTLINPWLNSGLRPEIIWASSFILWVKFSVLKQLLLSEIALIWGHRVNPLKFINNFFYGWLLIYLKLQFLLTSCLWLGSLSIPDLNSYLIATDRSINYKINQFNFNNLVVKLKIIKFYLLFYTFRTKFIFSLLIRLWLITIDFSYLFTQFGKLNYISYLWPPIFQKNLIERESVLLSFSFRNFDRIFASISNNFLFRYIYFSSIFLPKWQTVHTTSPNKFFLCKNH